MRGLDDHHDASSSKRKIFGIAGSVQLLATTGVSIASLPLTLEHRWDEEAITTAMVTNSFPIS
jgi:hypothetical protein